MRDLARLPPTPLPIDRLLPEIVDALRKHSSLILQAEPGAGKTTRVPAALLKAGTTDREIWVLQPRRLATRLAAQRVADELGERLGSTVGYQIRFDEVSSPKTRLRFVTEGILTRKLLSEPNIPSIGVVVLDEFHERHLAADMGLALLKRAQTNRPDLKVLVMSATLDVPALARYLNNCPIIHATGRAFEVTVEYLPAPDERMLEHQVLAGIKRLFSRADHIGESGHILVFLPGANEIRKTADACREFAHSHQLIVCPLYADLPIADQDRAVRPSSRQKLILATNVAETSLTIDGVIAVIDCGLARLASHSPWTGLPTLKIAKISRASAIQRAGRAGRTRAGVCLRLYTRHDFEGRPEHETPEVQRLDMTETALQLKALGFSRIQDFPLFEFPAPAAVESAEMLLRRLGALNPDGRLNALGHRLLSFPVHPRLARILVESEQKQVLHDGAKLAALLSERDSRSTFTGGDNCKRSVSGRSDLLEMLEARSFHPSVERISRQLISLASSQAGKGGGKGRGLERLSPAWEDALLYCILTGFPDRVSKRKKKHGSEVLLFAGGTAQISDVSVVKDSEYIVSVDVDERSTQSKRAQTLVRIASHVDAEWLMEVSPEDFIESDIYEWNALAQRVERVTRLGYGQLTLDETRGPAPDSPQARKVAEEALDGEVRGWMNEEDLSTLGARRETFQRAFPEHPLPPLDGAAIRRMASELFIAQGTAVGINGPSLVLAWIQRLPHALGQQLSKAVPEKIHLSSGRSFGVCYFRDQPPCIEAKIQDFFGMKQAPLLGEGRIPLTLHLLAPNRRPVQVTSDLMGFWTKHYPSIRKELSRRYPRHFWPEDPISES